MKIAVWDSESEVILNFVQTAESFSDVLLYDAIEDVFDAPDEEVDLIVFDYDSDKKQVDKFVKKFRKDNDEIKILILSNLLSPKQLVKHQNSKSGGDIYLRSPVTLDLLKSIFEPFFDIEIDGESSGVVPPAPSLSKEDRSAQNQIVSEHQSSGETSEEAKLVSESIQKKFNIVFPEEENNAANMLEEIAKQEALEAQELENSEISLDEISLDDEIKIPDEDDLTYPDLSVDMLTQEDSEEDLNIDKEPDMSGLDETDLEMDDLETLELGGDELIETIDVEEGMDLSIDDEDSLDLSSPDEEGMTATVEDSSEMDLSLDDEGLDLSAEGDEPESIEVVTDELDLEASEPENIEEDSLDLSDDSLDLGDDDSFDLGGDDESLDLSTDEEDSLNIEEVAEIEENLTGDIEFGVNEATVSDIVEEESLSSNDLPAAPEDLAFGNDEDVTDQNLSFDSEEKTGHSDDVMAKLAEIDELMSDVPASNEQDATGEHEIPPELHAQSQLEAIDDMTEIIPVQIPEENEHLDDLAFGNDDVAEEEISFSAQNESEDITSEVKREIPVGTPSMTEHKQYMEHHGEELSRYGETIKSLRDERAELLAKIDQLEDKNESLRRDQLSMKSELDEKKIELSIVKKRHDKQTEELKYHLDLSNDKKEILEEKNKQFENEYENLNRKIKVDLNKVRSRERDLENKLEMLRADAELQIRNRDQKILELKRKIDTLQFDVESIQVQERKISSNSHQLEDKMQKVIRTLRRAIGDLEEDGSSIRSIEEIKKNLDV